jgi:hypothetical protein
MMMADLWHRFHHAVAPPCQRGESFRTSREFAATPHLTSAFASSLDEDRRSEIQLEKRDKECSRKGELVEERMAHEVHHVWLVITKAHKRPRPPRPCAAIPEHNPLSEGADTLSGADRVE